VSEQANRADDILEACLVAGISMGLAFLAGSVWPAFRHPFVFPTIGVLAGVASWFRPDIRAAAREHKAVAVAVAVAVVIVFVLSYVSPTYFARLLP
jgi:hypothetical protein